MKLLLILIWTVHLNNLITATSGKLPNKLIGGNPVRITDYKYQVSIQIKNYHICGGTIIGKRHVFTSAGCISSEISDNIHVTYAGIKVLSGTADLLEDGRLDDRTLTDVSYIIYHEGFNSRNFFIHDIAILKLEKPLIFGFYRGKVSLSIQRKNRVQVYITGWGERSPGHITRSLQYIDAKSMNPRSCRVLYQQLFKLSTDQDCIAPQSSMARITPGNGGSAAMRVFKITGVLSLTQTDPKLPALYTRTSEYNNWVEKHMKAF